MGGDDCYSVQIVDKRGQESLHHLFDVRLPSGRLYSNEIKIIDNLDDGSMKYGIIYGDNPENPGWNDKGMWLYSNVNLISKPNTSLDMYSNIKIDNLTNCMERLSRINLTYDSFSGQLYASSTDGKLNGVKFDIHIAGTVKGYVETFPNGTMLAGKDNYCDVPIDITLPGIVISSSNTSIDGGAIKTALDAVSSKYFFDSYDSIGATNSYMHAAHPLWLNIKIEIRASSASQVYPIEFIWDVDKLPYYHSQDNTTYWPSIFKTMPPVDYVYLKRK